MADYFEEMGWRPLENGEQPNHLLHMARFLIDFGMFDDNFSGEWPRVCKCPPTLDNVCACKGSRRANCRDVAEVYDLLTKDGKKTCEKKKPVPIKYPEKVYKPRHFKDTCVPMTPSMHTRLRYITHCPNEPLKPSCGVCGSRRDEGPDTHTPWTSSDDEASGILKSSGRKGRRAALGRVKRVRYFDLMPGDVMMPTPQPYVMHGTPDVENMVDVPSPKTSGDLAPAERAEVRPNEKVPPMPPNSGYRVFGPHSGIFVNTDPHFTPDYDVPTGHEKIMKKRRRKRRKFKPFVKGQCGNKTCRAKRCLKYGPVRKKGGSRRKRAHRDIDECPDDEIPKPEHVIPPNLRKGTLQTHSLTVLNCNKERKPHIQYGILLGSVNMFDQKYSNKSRGKQGMVISVMAYCLAFHYHPKQWTMKLIDNLIDAADLWYLELLEKVHDHSLVYGMCEVLPFAKKNTLNLNGKKMQVLVGEPEIVGYTMTQDPTIYNLCRGLKAFFAENRAGVLMTRVLKIVIWRDRVCFYIFDGAGRDKRANSKFGNSAAALINVKDLPTLADVLLARTIVEDQKYVLAPLKVTKMLDENADEDFESDPELTQAEKAMMGYRILSENCAVVNANMHLGDKSFEDAKFRQALPVAVVAMTYAKISPPNTWHAKTLDKILRLGNKLYLQCRHPKVLIDLTIDNIPNEICIGPYACEIIIYRERVKGQLFTPKECINNIKRGLDEFFSREYNSGIIEFNNYYLAVWRQKEMYYLFDPYPRTSDGTRTAQGGKGCCLMLLNPESVYQVFLKNWDYMPLTTLFVIHGFKVLKLKKKDLKMKLVCTLSDEHLPGVKKKLKRQVLEAAAQGRGDFQKETFHDTSPNENVKGSAVQGNVPCQMDEEKMGDIISLVDSIQEEYLTPIPLRYKNMAPDPMEPRQVNLDSPTCSVTQVIPPWPKARDKTNEPPDPDPDPEPSPPPTPPPPPEGGEEEAEDEEDAEDEETARLKAEEEARRRAEEEEARRKALELPPPLPPPPPSPQEEPELAPLPVQMIEDEIEIIEPADVDRRILLTEDAKKRYKMRQLRNKQQPPLSEKKLEITPSQEIMNPYNFTTLPDLSQIVRGSASIKNEKAQEMMPFAAIMAIVTSYKYTISTWTSGIVTFVIDTAGHLYKAKTDKFQFAPLHIIPRIKIGNQVYQVVIDVVGEGATWQLEDILERKFFKRFDRGMITTCNYSSAIFLRNGLYYLFDASPCSAMGLRQDNNKGNACFIRFRNLHDLVTRILYNKDGRKDDQQFILSHIIVRRLMTEPRMKLPEDYDFVAMKPKSTRSKPTFIAPGTEVKKKPTELVKAESDVEVGYQEVNGSFRIEGTTHLSDIAATSGVKGCHFVCLVTMLLATMHPVMTWDPIMIDTCVEKGLEIYAKSINRTVCEKRAIKNIILDGKFINVNIKKILVINENLDKTVEQFMNAVLARLRYVIVWYPTANFVICQTDGFYHFFDPYSRPISKTSDSTTVSNTSKTSSGSSIGTSSSATSKGSPSRKASSASNASTQRIPSSTNSNVSADRKSSVSSLEKKLKESSKHSKNSKTSKTSKKSAKSDPKKVLHACWTLYRSVDGIINKLKSIVPAGQVNAPEFYTFELTSVKNAPKYSILNCKLCPLFKPETNPNEPYTKRRKVPPLVDEKMYWLLSGSVPWSRMNPVNDLGIERRTPKSVWNDWDIEMPGDLYSLWGSMHPLDERFDEPFRGKQYLATCVVALALAQKCELNAWTGSLLDGIVIVGDKYYSQSKGPTTCQPNTELTLDHLATTFTDMYPYSFSVKFQHVIFGFVYNILPDRFNLSRAVIYFFEKHNLGILISCTKNIAFGKAGASFFMYDCQSFGMPVFSPGTGASYMLKCESLNRLIYCMVLTLNLKKHGQQFNLYGAKFSISEMK